MKIAVHIDLIYLVNAQKSMLYQYEKYHVMPTFKKKQL